MTGKLLLIASYPKSGNTWVRIFLEHLLHPDTASINTLDPGLYGFVRRRAFDALSPLAAGDLLPAELERMLPAFFAQVARDADGPALVKTHERIRRTQDHTWLFPPEHVGAALYLVRHPFDVAASYAQHRGVDVAVAVADMCDSRHVTAEVRAALPLPLAERLGDWNSHVEAWLGSPLDVSVVRYEDLLSDSMLWFSRLAASAGLDAAPARIAAAVDAARFERLAAAEKAQDFRERPLSAKNFFRNGKRRSWRGTLNADFRQLLATSCANAMRRLGYREDGGVDPLPLDLSRWKPGVA
ncbi:MAG: sulfotransferase domain-containing protein [Rhizomicrobium sp.]